MSELQVILEDLNLQEYLCRLAEHGFDTWDSLAGITETDMATLGIRLGHRRRLQRENARRLGHPANEPLFDLPAAAPQMMRGQYTSEDRVTNSGHPNRRCRRRPLRDPHVLPRSDTGYTAYARFLRQDPKVSNLSLVGFAGFVGKRWSSLSGELKDTWNEIATAENNTHNSQLSPSASASTTLDETDVSLSRHGRSPTISAYGSTKADLDEPLIESIWKIISQEQAPYPADLPVQLRQDDLLSYTCQHPTRSKSLHVKTINPFAFQRRPMIWPMIDSFLRNVNSVYCLVNPDDLWNDLDSALDTNLETSNLTTSAVCVCIALGCQNYHADATDMAIMWYENGRRYLDDRDWCLDPAVMQVLALISMFHMAQRPATSSHYLDIAIRIGEANDLHKTSKQTGDSCVIQWLDTWNTIQTLHRILLLGCGADGSVLCVSQTPPHDTVTPCHDTRAQSTVANIAFGELSNTLGCVQQQLSQSNNLLLWRGGSFVQELKMWLYNLPDELSLPMIPGIERWDLGLIKNVLLGASDVRKIELLHLYSLYFGVIVLLTGSSLQQVVTADTEQPPSAIAETESYAYECLNSALRQIDLCTVFSHVSFFPIYAWLPQCVLFTSSLACTLGIIWQRQVLVRDTAASQEWLKRSYNNIRDALVIFRHCATGNEQAQRHYKVLQRIFRWLPK